MNEQQFLQNYSQDRYDRPSIATDIAAFSLRTIQSEAYRAPSGTRKSIIPSHANKMLKKPSEK